MPKEQESRATLPATRGAQARLPGRWQAVAVAGLSALAVGWWARPGAGAPGPAAATSISRVAEVAPKDLAAALGTVAGSTEQIAQFRERETCSRRLASVTIMRRPGQPPSDVPARIRLQSGAYLSPVFVLGDAPVRVALPFPAPYAAGRGTISVLGATADAIVSLTPPWSVAAQEGLHARQVTWIPTGTCPGAAN